MRLVYWLLTGLFALVAASFAVSNRQPVEIGLWPLPDVYGIPLFLVTGAAFATGIAIGAAISWARHGKTRSERRRHARRVELLEAELASRRAGPPAPIPPVP